MISFTSQPFISVGYSRENGHSGVYTGPTGRQKETVSNQYVERLLYPMVTVALSVARKWAGLSANIMGQCSDETCRL